MPTTEPTITLEIEFTAGVWTDVSAYFRRANPKRGKQRAIDRTTVGTMTVVLSNQGRIFDPEYTGARPAGFAIPAPQMRIRLRATWNAITYDVFTGYIDRILQSYTPPKDAVAIMECSDGFSKLVDKLPSPWEIETKKLIPWTWLRLGERTGPTAFDSSGNNHHGLYVGNPTHSEPSMVGPVGTEVSDEDHATLFPAGTNYVLCGKNTLPATSSWTIAFILKLVALPVATQYLLFDTVYPRGLSISISPTGVLTATVIKSDSTVGSTVFTSFGLAVDTPYAVTITAAAGSTPKIYFGDDPFATTGAAGTVHDILSSDAILGLLSTVGITVDEFTVWDRALSQAEITARTRGFNFWSGDTVSTRVTRILDTINWPVASRSITAASDTEGTLIETGLRIDALSHLEDIRTTIEGRLWIRPNGTLTLLGRNEHLVSPYSVSQGTFGDAVGQLHYSNMGNYALDYLTIANVVNRWNDGPFIPDGSVITATDTVSTAKYSVRSVDIHSLFTLVTPENDLAYFHLAHYANPVPYIEGLEIIPRNDPANLWPQVLGRDLGDRITFERRPQNVGTAISTETIIEGVTHDIAPKSWVTRFMIDATYAQRYFLFDSTLWDATDWRFAA